MTRITITLNSSTNSTNPSVPKLHDNRSNWADYEPQIQKATGSKGLWRHIEGTMIALKPYAMVNKLSFYQMERFQLQRNKSRQGKHESLIMKSRSISLNMLSSWQPWHVSVEKSRTWSQLWVWNSLRMMISRPTFLNLSSTSSLCCSAMTTLSKWVSPYLTLISTSLSCLHYWTLTYPPNDDSGWMS